MAKISATVLIKTAAPPKNIPHVQMTNTIIRKMTAKAALYFWVAQDVEKIVLADATKTNLLTENELAELKY